MHELSVAMNIIDIADEYFKKSDASKIYNIELEIGELSGIIIESLEFAMNHAVKGSVLENASLNICIKKGIARCKSCNEEFEMNEPYTSCPKCSEYNSEIIAGKEMRVKSLMVE